MKLVRLLLATLSLTASSAAWPQVAATVEAVQMPAWVQRAGGRLPILPRHATSSGRSGLHRRWRPPVDQTRRGQRSKARGSAGARRFAARQVRHHRTEDLGLTWVAAAFGIAGGLALAVSLARVLFGQRLFTRAVAGGMAAALLPALLLAVAAGAPLGAALGRRISADLFGVAAGVALTFAIVVVAGGAAGLGVAKAVSAYRLWRE